MGMRHWILSRTLREQNVVLGTMEHWEVRVGECHDTYGWNVSAKEGIVNLGPRLGVLCMQCAWESHVSLFELSHYGEVRRRKPHVHHLVHALFSVHIPWRFYRNVSTGALFTSGNG